MQIVAEEPAVIIQIKRPPPRSIEKQEDFIEVLEASLALAADEAENSVSLAFNDKSYKLNNVVLIAVVNGGGSRLSTVPITHQSTYLEARMKGTTNQKRTTKRTTKGKESDFCSLSAT